MKKTDFRVKAYYLCFSMINCKPETQISVTCYPLKRTETKSDSGFKNKPATGRFACEHQKRCT